MEKKGTFYSWAKTIKGIILNLKQGVELVMENSVIKEKIQSFMEENFLLEFNDDITEDTDLFREGIINSFGYIKFINYLENEFGIKFTEDEILSNVFVTFASVVECVSQKV